MPRWCRSSNQHGLHCHLHPLRLEAIALRLEAIATTVEAIAIRLEAITTNSSSWEALGWNACRRSNYMVGACRRPSVVGSSVMSTLIVFTRSCGVRMKLMVAKRQLYNYLETLFSARMPKSAEPLLLLASWEFGEHPQAASLESGSCGDGLPPPPRHATHGLARRNDTSDTRVFRQPIYMQAYASMQQGVNSVRFI